MEQRRQLIFFQHYFRDFYDSLDKKIQEKVDYVLFLVRSAERIPSKFFQYMTGTDGLFDIGVKYQGNIFRFFCCFDDGNLVVLFNGFQKKTQKTPKSDLEKALKIKEAYFELKRKSK